MTVRALIDLTWSGQKIIIKRYCKDNDESITILEGDTSVIRKDEAVISKEVKYWGCFYDDTMIIVIE